MEESQQLLQTLALAFGSAWASGINLYAVILVIGLLGSAELVALPAGMQLLQDPVVLVVAGLMYLAEFLADKIPGVDSTWDAVHTLIRIPAGAVLAAAAFSDVDPAYVLAAALVGGTLAAGSHITKTSTRLLVNTSPEPFSNIGFSILEDILVVLGLCIAFLQPWLLLALLGLFVLFLLWALPVLLRGVRSLFRTLKGLWRKGLQKQLADP